MYGDTSFRYLEAFGEHVQSRWHTVQLTAAVIRNDDSVRAVLDGLFGILCGEYCRLVRLGHAFRTILIILKALTSFDKDFHLRD